MGWIKIFFSSSMLNSGDSDWLNWILISRQRFLRALDTSLPRSSREFWVIVKIALNLACLTTSRKCPSIKPYSFIVSAWAPSSSKPFRRSSIEGLHRFAFSKTAQWPSYTACTSTESTHSNLLVELFSYMSRLRASAKWWGYWSSRSETSLNLTSLSVDQPISYSNL